jgi:hypothetical protein
MRGTSADAQTTQSVMPGCSGWRVRVPKGRGS